MADISFYFVVGEGGGKKNTEMGKVMGKKLYLSMIKRDLKILLLSID